MFIQTAEGSKKRLFDSIFIAKENDNGTDSNTKKAHIENNVDDSLAMVDASVHTIKINPKYLTTSSDINIQRETFCNDMYGKCIRCKMDGLPFDHSFVTCMNSKSSCFKCTEKGHTGSSCNKKIIFSKGNCYFCGFKDHRFKIDCKTRMDLTIPLAWLLFRNEITKLEISKRFDIPKSEVAFVKWLGSDYGETRKSGVQILFEWFILNVILC